MRRLSVFNNVTLDGYFTSPDGDMTWAHKRDPEWTAFTSGNAGGQGELLFGLVTYEMMASFWPTPQAAQKLSAVAEGMNSQAKRVLVGLERFRGVYLNFKGVPSIGPAFADEIFRVWKSAHPGTAICHENASPEVARMIARSEAANRLDKLPTDR